MWCSHATDIDNLPLCPPTSMKMILNKSFFIVSRKPSYSLSLSTFISQVESICFIINLTGVDNYKPIDHF